MREYILAVRGMLEEGSAQYKGNNSRLSWHKSHVPIHIAAEGPKTLRLAGEVADGVIIGTGLIPEVIADTLSFIDEGAKKSGKRVEDLDLWWLVDAHVDADGAAQRGRTSAPPSPRARTIRSPSRWRTSASPRSSNPPSTR